MSLIEYVGGAQPLGLDGTDSSARVRVPVVLSNRNATPTEEADALLRSLGFTEADLREWSRQHNGEDLRQKFIDNFTTNLRAGRTDHSGHTSRTRPDGRINAYIGVSANYHKQLTDFVRAQRGNNQSVTPQVENSGSGAGQTARGQETRAYGDARRRQVEATPPVVAATTIALPAAQLGGRVAPMLPAVAPALIEAAPIVAIGTVAAAPAILVGTHLGQRYVEGQQAAAAQAQANAQRALEARDAAELQRIIESAPQATTVPPFGNNEPLPPPPPLVNLDRSEEGRRLSEPLTTPAAPSQVATNTPPMSNPQPLPPPPPLVNPIQEQDRLSHLIMATYPGATTEESVRIKLESYLLNPAHPIGGAKARWYEQALGFTRSNIDELARQLVFDPTKAAPTELTPFGQKYVQPTLITGANGRQIEVGVGWITNPDGVTRIVTAPPAKK